jgi:hypothetical protein
LESTRTRVPTEIDCGLSVYPPLRFVFTRTLIFVYIPFHSVGLSI